MCCSILPAGFSYQNLYKLVQLSAFLITILSKYMSPPTRGGLKGGLRILETWSCAVLIGEISNYLLKKNHNRE